MKKYLFILFFVILFTGCSQQKGSVTGSVSWKGQPVEDGVIEFQPLEDKTLPVTPADIKDGTYTASVPFGKKRVSISSFKKVGTEHPSGPDGPAIDVIKET